MLPSQPPTIALVIPCYNEDPILKKTLEQLSAKLEQLIETEKISSESFLFLVDDGSVDNTWQIISDAAGQSKNIRGCKLSRNFGHQSALLAGISCCRKNCDALISLDADLQQDINALDLFIDSYIKGNELVFGVRKDRKSDSRFKALTATGFYSIMRAFGVPLIRHHADYRLLGNKAIEALLNHPETELFLRAQCLNLGFPQDTVYFDVQEREEGKSKYTLRRMLSLALVGITSFSSMPLRVISAIGLIVFLVSVIMAGYVFMIYFIHDKAVPGWASTVLPIYFLGGVQILCLGVISEYLAKIYKETKRRPPFIIETHLKSPMEGSETHMK